MKRIDRAVLKLVPLLLASAGCGNLSLITPAVRTDVTFRDAEATAGATVPSTPACPDATACLDASAFSGALSAMTITVGTAATTAELQVLGEDDTDLVTAENSVDAFDLSAPGNTIGSIFCCKTPDYPGNAEAAISGARFVFAYYDLTFEHPVLGEQTIRFVNGDVPELGYVAGDKLLKVGEGEYRWCIRGGACNQSTRPTNDLLAVSDTLLNYVVDDLPAGDNESVVPFRATVEVGGLLPRADLLVNNWVLTVDFTMAGQMVFLAGSTAHTDLPQMVYEAEFNGAPWATGLTVNIATQATGFE